MTHLTLIRHGESEWNHAQRFTGWANIGMTDLGARQMRNAAEAVSAAGMELDVAYSSALDRCIRSLWLLLDTLGTVWVPQHIDWRLNERHYGALTGQLKHQAELRYGRDAVRDWRRSYNAQPPEIDADAAKHVQIDRRYDAIHRADIPRSESLRQTVQRVSNFWDTDVIPQLGNRKSVVIVAHGNSLRALTKIIEGLSDAEITKIEISNGEPIVYEFDSTLKVRGKRVLHQSEKTKSYIL